MAKHGFKVFDSDMHIMEPPDLWQRYIDPEFRAQAPIGVTSENVRDLRLIFPGMTPPSGVPPSGRNFERNQLLYADHARRGWSPDVQLEAMDLEGIDVAVMFPSRGLLPLTRPNMEPRFANAVARAYNDWLHEFCSAYPDRMYGAGAISVYDIGHAVEETHRVVEELGFKAIFVRSNMVTGKPWHDKYYDPLWDTLEKLDVPLGFHEATGSWSRQTADHFLPNFGMMRVFGQPVEQMIAMGSFLTGGILARHPKLRVAFLEANCSWAPWLIWRMDEGWELEGDVFMPEVTEPPSTYFKRQCIISVEPDEHPSKYMLEEFGSDNLVYSTDYPHGDSRYPKATESFLELPFSDEDKRKILWDNCARFYKVSERKGALAS
jgi:predicted TIM-barrel fold metal-dependent hydrolase